MHKILFIVLTVMSFVAFPVMGAYQYGDYVYFDQSHGNRLNVVKSGSLTLNFTPALPSYGYNITDWNTLTVKATNSDGSVTSRTVNITGSSVNIGNVMQGSSLQFYLSGQQGSTVASNFWGSGWDTSAGQYGSYEYLHFGGNYGANNSGYMNQQFQVQGAPASGGQPLPGVALSLILGGISLWAIKRKKAKSAVTKLP